MREVTNFDKLMMVLLLCLVIGIFYLGLVLKDEGGTCAMNPCTYALDNNISCIENEMLLNQINQIEREREISSGNLGVINFSENYSIEIQGGNK